mmetsp:Transcript_3897/g.11442  ORF Transcript_3897/g.11442 Transcript_3897/m.11442 type:complete len:228 (+) Transcript_3897:155-838(+)
MRDAIVGYMPGQSMYAGAWDVLMLTFDVGCSTGLALKPPGGPSAAAAVAIVAVPAARDWVQARRVVGVSAAAEATMRKMLRITACLTACKLGSSVLCEVGTLSPSARKVTRCMRFTAMQQRPRTWFAPLAAENWGCNPALAEPVPGEPDSTRRLRVAIDHSQLITGPVVTYRRAEESWGINAAAHAPHHTPPSSACKCCSQNVLGGTRGTLVVEESRTLAPSTSAKR